MIYTIVLADNQLRLQAAVNQYIDDGWAPQGGAFLTHYSDKRFGQAMVRKNETPTGERPMTQWQPIKTAPKDGTRILAWSKNEGVNLVDWQVPSENDKQKGWRDGWYDIATFQYIPTHWMPLPPPPTGEEQ